MSHCVQEPVVSTNPQVQELVTKARVAQADVRVVFAGDKSTPS